MPFDPRTGRYPMINEQGEACWDAIVKRDDSGSLMVMIVLDPEAREPSWLEATWSDHEAREVLLALDAELHGGGTA